MNYGKLLHIIIIKKIPRMENSVSSRYAASVQYFSDGLHLCMIMAQHAKDSNESTIITEYLSTNKLHKKIYSLTPGSSPFEDEKLILMLEDVLNDKPITLHSPVIGEYTIQLVPHNRNWLILPDTAIAVHKEDQTKLF